MKKFEQVAVFFLIALSLAGCRKDPEPETKTSAPVPRGAEHKLITLTRAQLKDTKITTAPVRERLVDEEIELLGEVQENDYLSTPVISLVPGRIERVEVLLGDQVRKGQVLAAVRSDEVARIESELLKEELNLLAERKQTRVELGVAEKAFERHKSLFDEGIGARAQLELAKATYEQAQAKLESLEEKIASLKTTARERLKLFGISGGEVERLMRTKVVDNMFDVVSPRNGKIVERHVDLGQSVDISQPLFVVSDLSEVWVNAEVFEHDLRHLRKGQPVNVHVESYPDKQFPGKVEYIGTNLSPKTRTLPVRANVSNLDFLLLPRMYAHITVKTGTREAIVVPAGALQKTGEATLVYVVRSANAFEERQVKLSKVRKDLALVDSGLVPGEMVAVGGSLQLLGLAVKQESGGVE